MPAEESELRLRAVGWHFFNGLSWLGQTMRDALCPNCLKKPRRGPSVVLDDQIELF